MGKGTPWTNEEVQLLKENYRIKSKEELLSIFPKRTWKAITNKANSLGIRMVNDYEPINEDELYKEIDGVVHKICKCCRRYLPLEMLYFPKDEKCKDGFRGVCKECKGENFTLSTAIEWSDEDVKILIDNYSTMTNEELIIKYFPNRKNKHLVDKASVLGLKKDYETYCRSKEKKEESRIKISMARKMEGAFVGRKNPMFNSKRFGELNPNWKGGITEDRNTEEYRQWRMAVFERDNYTCQCCGKKTHYLEAHHLDNYAEYKDKRFDVDNGILLCRWCHNSTEKGSFHNECGTIGNTKEQFYRWMESKKGLVS